MAEQLICNQQVDGSTPFTSSNMGDFPSGQRGQTVNLLSLTSVVRIHHPPPKNPIGICLSGFLLLDFAFVTTSYLLLANWKCLRRDERYLLIDFAQICGHRISRSRFAPACRILLRKMSHRKPPPRVYVFVLFCCWTLLS